MPPNSPLGQDSVSHRRVKAAGRHGHRAQAIALAQHHADEGHAQMRRGDEHAAHMAHLRLLLDLRADHEAGRVDQADDRQAVRVAQLHETRRLVGRIGIDGAAQVLRVVGHQPTARPSMRPSAVWMPKPKPCAAATGCPGRPGRP
jgi:hypothetical protein